MAYFIYILSNNFGAIYIGVTNNLDRRLYEHRYISRSGYVHKYKVHRLIYFENTEDINSALSREKELKGWTRKKKLELVRRSNPGFKDLGEGWFDEETFGD